MLTLILAAQAATMPTHAAPTMPPSDSSVPMAPAPDGPTAAPSSEPAFPAATISSNNDGVMDAWDLDGDGKADVFDTTGDGKPDAADRDGDGVPETSVQLKSDAPAADAPPMTEPSIAEPSTDDAGEPG